MNAIDLYQVLLDRTIGCWRRPAKSGSIRADARERDIRGFGDIDAEHVDEFGYGFPQSLP